MPDLQRNPETSLNLLDNYSKNCQGKRSEEHNSLLAFIHNVNSHTHCNQDCERLTSSPSNTSSHSEGGEALALATPETYDPERQCRICLITNVDGITSSKQKAIIAPCRCAGTMKFVHSSCLTHWIEVSSRKMYPTPRCELCGYKYRRKPFIDLTQIHFPFIECCDRILNILFLFLIGIMFLCAYVAFYYLQIAERKPIMRSLRNGPPNNSKRFLSESDVTVIIATILFFAAFFIALFTQYRAEVTVLRLITRLWTTNRNWRIRNYLPEEDDQHRPQNTGSPLTNDILKTPTNSEQNNIQCVINNANFGLSDGNPNEKKIISTIKNNYQSNIVQIL